LVLTRISFAYFGGKRKEERMFATEDTEARRKKEQDFNAELAEGHTGHREE
jgi:hypothetical protein